MSCEKCATFPDAPFPDHDFILCPCGRKLDPEAMIKYHRATMKFSYERICSVPEKVSIWTKAIAEVLKIDEERITTKQTHPFGWTVFLDGDKHPQLTLDENDVLYEMVKDRGALH